MENENVKDKIQNLDVRGTDIVLPGPMSGLPSVEEMQARMARMSALLDLRETFIREKMVKGQDYGLVPGAKKPSLWKSGAEKILMWYGYYAYLELTSEKEDFGAEIFAYVYRCEIRQVGTNIAVAVCEGDCSTRETKYGYRWVARDQLPENADVSSLSSRIENGKTQYRVLSDNPADKRNTARKMAQKRAFVGATMIGCALSSIFDQEMPPGDDDEQSGNLNPEEYGEPINDKQGKRLYAIRMNKGIDNKAFRTWLKAKYNLDDDRKIGINIYDEICKACESGKLEMPAKSTPAQPATDPTPAQGAGSPASTGAKISVAQTKDFYMLLNSLGKTENQFKEWLSLAYPQMAGNGINDLMSADVDAIKHAFHQYCDGEAQ